MQAHSTQSRRRTGDFMLRKAKPIPTGPEFDDLFMSHWGELTARAMRYASGDGELADRILHRTMIFCWQTWGRAMSADRPIKWAYGTMRFAAHHERDVRERDLAVECQQIDSSPSPERVAYYRQLIRRARGVGSDAMASEFYAGSSLHEVSEGLGVSMKTAYRRRRKLFNEIRKIVDGDAGDPLEL